MQPHQEIHPRGINLFPAGFSHRLLKTGESRSDVLLVPRPPFISPSRSGRWVWLSALSQEEGDSNASGRGALVIQAAVLLGLRSVQGHHCVQVKQCFHDNDQRWRKGPGAPVGAQDKTSNQERKSQSCRKDNKMLLTAHLKI